MSTEHDELEQRNGSRPPLSPDAGLEDVIAAINALAKASRTHGIELAGIRLAVQEQSTRIETFCQRIERAVGYARERTTDPPPVAPTEGT